MVPIAIPVPLPEDIVDRAPGREIPRQHAPLAARAKKVKKRVQNLPHIRLSRSPSRPRRRNERCKSLPLTVRQIRRIPLSCPVVIVARRRCPHWKSSVQHQCGVRTSLFLNKNFLGQTLRALSGQIEPFDRSYFAPWLGALRMAMWGIGKDARATPRSNWTRPLVGQIGSPGSLRHSPDDPASRFAPSLPGKPNCHHQIDPIWSDSAPGAAAGLPGVSLFSSVWMIFLPGITLRCCIYMRIVRWRILQRRATTASRAAPIFAPPMRNAAAFGSIESRGRAELGTSFMAGRRCHGTSALSRMCDRRHCRRYPREVKSKRIKREIVSKFS